LKEINKFHYTDKQIKQIESRIRAEKSRNNKLKATQDLKDENDELKKIIILKDQELEDSYKKMKYCKRCGDKLNFNQIQNGDTGLQDRSSNNKIVICLTNNFEFIRETNSTSDDNHGENGISSERKKNKDSTKLNLRVIFALLLLFIIGGSMIYNGRNVSLENVKSNTAENGSVDSSDFNYNINFNIFNNPQNQELNPNINGQKVTYSSKYKNNKNGIVSNLQNEDYNDYLENQHNYNYIINEKQDNDENNLHFILNDDDNKNLKYQEKENSSSLNKAYYLDKDTANNQETKYVSKQLNMANHKNNEFDSFIKLINNRRVIFNSQREDQGSNDFLEPKEFIT